MILGYRCASADIEVTHKEVKEAQRRLRDEFIFVGLTEAWDLSICLFHQVGLALFLSAHGLVTTFLVAAFLLAAFILVTVSKTCWSTAIVPLLVSYWSPPVHCPRCSGGTLEPSNS